MIGDITELTTREYVEALTEAEQIQRDIDDAAIRTLAAPIELITSSIDTTRYNNRFNNIDSLYQLFENKAELFTPKLFTSLEYTQSNTLLKYFPDLPSNTMRTEYYINYVNLVNSFLGKFKNFEKTIEILTSDITVNPDYIKLVNLNNVKLPELITEIDKMIMTSSASKRTFKDIISAIREFEKSEVGSIMTQTKLAVEDKAAKVQDVNTGTRYKDTLANKYYKMYVNNGILSIMETHPYGTILFGQLFLVETFFGTYTAVSELGTQEINLITATNHRTIVLTVPNIPSYSLQTDLSTVHSSYLKMSCLQARFRGGHYEDAPFAEKYLSTKKTIELKTDDYYYIIAPLEFNSNNGTTSHGCINIFNKNMYKIAAFPLNENVKSGFVSPDNKILLMSATDAGTNLESIISINLEMIFDEIHSQVSQGTNYPIMGQNSYVNTVGYKAKQLLKSYYCPQCDSTNIKPLSPVSISYDETTQICSFSFAENYIFLFSLSLGKETNMFGDESETYYTNSLKYEFSYRFGLTISDADKITLFATNINFITKTITAAAFNHTSAKSIIISSLFSNQSNLQYITKYTTTGYGIFMHNSFNKGREFLIYKNSDNKDVYLITNIQKSFGMIDRDGSSIFYYETDKPEFFKKNAFLIKNTTSKLIYLSTTQKLNSNLILPDFTLSVLNKDTSIIVSGSDDSGLTYINSLPGMYQYTQSFITKINSLDPNNLGDSNERIAENYELMRLVDSSVETIGVESIKLTLYFESYHETAFTRSNDVSTSSDEYLLPAVGGNIIKMQVNLNKK